MDDGAARTTPSCATFFQRISNKTESRQGIRELYEFQKRNPHLEKHVENSLQKTGPIFQRFIKRALANHAAEDPDVMGAGGGGAAAGGGEAEAAEVKRGSTPSGASANGSSTGACAVATPGTPRSSRFSAAAAGAAGDGSMGSPSSSATQSPRGSSIRSSATEDRLAQLRAKFSS